MQKLPAAIMVVSRDGRVLMFNPACEAVIGPSLSVGKHVFDVFPNANSGPPFRHRSGYVFTASNNDPSGADGVVLSGIPSQIGRCEDLLTQVNGFSELLLESVSHGNAMWEDLERVHAASAEAISVFRELRLANRR